MAHLSDPVKEQMNIVFVGHVDHGKSTIVGRLLADTNSLPKGKLEQVQENCRRASKPFEYAYLIDALKDEQAQAITIDAARVFFQTRKRHYIIIDAPGHIEFIKNMVTGASHAEAAVLVIDAMEGVQENSRRHGYLLWMLGIKKVVVLVNKMDLVGYEQATYERIVTEYQAYLSGLGLDPLCYIPVSGREGGGVANSGKEMPWYKGETLLKTLDALPKDQPLPNQPLRLPVQDVYKFNDMGDARRIIAGTISSGSLKVGDEIILQPSGKKTHVKTFESFNTAPVTKAQAGQAVGFTMQEQIYIKPGQVVTRTKDAPPQVGKRLRVSLFWLSKSAFVKNKDYTFKLGTCREKVQLEQIHAIIDASDYAGKNDLTGIGHHDVAEVTLRLAHPIAFDITGNLAETSRFVLVDDFQIRGGGIVLEALPDEETQIRADVELREQKWIQSDVNMAARAEKYNQRSCIVLVTGEKGAGRKTLARRLETALFNDGKLVYYLGIGSLLYGVNADLKRHDAPGGWREHVRRFAEVSHLFVDAGIILIVTVVEATQADLDVLRAVVGEDLVHTVWVGDAVTTDVECDIQLRKRDTFDQGVLSIKRLLQERGVIFKP